MERREFVAGVGGIAVSGWLDVTDVEKDDQETPTPEVVARETADDGTRIPVRLHEGATVTVEVSVEADTEHTVAVMSLDTMTRKTVEGDDELVADIDGDGEYLVDVTGEGRSEVRVVRG